MVLAGRFEVDPLVLPAHRPVHPPGQFDRTGFAQIEGLLFTGVLTAVGHTPLAVPAEHRGVVAVGKGAEHGNRPPVLRQRLGAVLIEDGPDGIPLLQGRANALGIERAAVALGLVDVFGLNPHLRQQFLQCFFIRFGVTGIAALGIRHDSDRFAEILGQQLLIRHVFGNLSEYVVIVP